MDFTDRNALTQALIEARQYTLRCYAELDDAAWRTQRMQPGVNLPCWEEGHIAWFQEWWCLREARLGTPSRYLGSDALYDSTVVPFESRFGLNYPSRLQTHDYMASVLAATLDSLAAIPKGQRSYFHELVLLHEDMHAEALLMTLQSVRAASAHAWKLAPLLTSPAQDVRISGGPTLLGALPNSERFVWDNEKWGREVALPAFAMSSRLVSCREYLTFVESGGYRNTALWSQAGREWLRSSGLVAPRDWQRDANRWRLCQFNEPVPLDLEAPVLNVTAFEAEAYCAFAGRRLPTEWEWEAALKREPDAFPDAFNVGWQWTSSSFAPLPGFAPDPYAEYSLPWFDGQHSVLKGGSWATQARLTHAGFRNFYLPNRNDVFTAIRTCAL